MEDLIKKVSDFLGVKWVSLVTRLNFLKPNGRFHIESKYGYLKETIPSEYHRICAMECLITWLKSQKLDDQGKRQKLLTEMYKIDDFKDFVRELAEHENVMLPVEPGSDVSKSTPGKLKPLAVVAESADIQVNIHYESTTRSATFEQPQAQDTWAPIQDGGTSPMPFSSTSVSYGDASQGREGVSEAGARFLRADVNITPSVKLPDHEGRSLRPGETTSSWPEEDSSISSSGTHIGSGTLSTGALGDTDSTMGATYGEAHESGDSLSEDKDTLTSLSVVTVYSTAINLKVTQHLYTILDACQRIKHSNWINLGYKLNLGEAFIKDQEHEEEIEEKVYSMIKKWLDNGEGTATFQDLSQILDELEEEDAKLVLKERLEEELDEDNELLVGAIERDFLATSS